MRYLKRNMKKVVVAMLLICLVCVGTLTTKVLASDEYIVNSNVNAMMSEINTMIDNKDTAMESSNPYDYIQNDYFNNIVERGIGALPVLTSELDSSSENGLKEYILAIAIEEITETNMNEDTVNAWSNGKEWAEEWNRYLRNIPEKVEYVVNDTVNSFEEKKQELQSLGLMSLPYIKDVIDEGNTEYQDVYNEIYQSVSNVAGAQGIDSEDIEISSTELKTLRNIVEEARVN